MKQIADVKLICVESCTGLALNEEYRSMMETETEWKVMDTNGMYVWRIKSRFVEKGERV